MKATDISPSAAPNEAVPTETIASIITLHKPKRAKSSAERTRAYRERKRRKGKTAAAPNDQIPSSESIISEGVSLAASAVAETPLSPPPTVTSRDVGRHEEAPSRSISRILLLAAALALAGAGIAMNGWFARSLGSSDIAGWLFLAIGAAADLIALVMPSCAARLWRGRQRAISLAGWTTWALTFVFAVTAGIGFASTNIADVTLARASRTTPAVQTAQAALADAMAARDRECKGGGREVLPGARSGGQRTASGMGRCHAVGRTDGRPANGRGEPDRGVGNPWGASTYRQ